MLMEKGFYATMGCWIISPRYPAGFLPEIGEEISPDNIKGWRILRLRWSYGTA